MAFFHVMGLITRRGEGTETVEVNDARVHHSHPTPTFQNGSCSREFRWWEERWVVLCLRFGAFCSAGCPGWSHLLGIFLDVDEKPQDRRWFYTPLLLRKRTEGDDRVLRYFTSRDASWAPPAIARVFLQGAGDRASRCHRSNRLMNVPVSVSLFRPTDVRNWEPASLRLKRLLAGFTVGH